MSTILKRYISPLEQRTADLKRGDDEGTNEQPQGAPLGGLTEASKQFAQAALQYAQDHDCDFPTAVRALMRETKQYEISTEASAASELASAAKQVSSALKIDFLDALKRVAREHRAQVMQLADAWLIEQARTAARGRPGLQSENEANALREVISSNSDVAATRLSGVLTDSAMKKLFWTWIK